MHLVNPEMESRAKTLQTTIDAILAPHTTPQNRVVANQTCESYKTDLPPNDQWELATFIINSTDQNFNLTTKKFAIQLIQYFIVNNWNLLNGQQRTNTQSGLINCISNSENASKPVYILDAFAKCLTAIALRTWPQFWGGMLDDFNNLSKISAGHQQIILLSLTRLEEDVISIQPDTVGIVKKRRQELARAVSLETGSILEFICEKMVKALPLSHQPEIRPLITTGLQAYQAYGSWANPTHIFQGENRVEFLKICVLGLEQQNDVELAMDCTRTIISVTSSKTADIEKKSLLQFLTGGCFGSIKGAILKNIGEIGNEQCYQCCKLLAEMVSDLGRIVAACFSEDTKIIQEFGLDLQAFFQLIIDFCQAKSPWIGFNLVNPLIASFVKNKTLSTDPTFQEFISYFLQHLISDVKTASLEKYPTLELECDDSSQAENLFHQYKVSNATLFRTIIQFCSSQQQFDKLYTGFLDSFQGGMNLQPLYEGALRIYSGNLPGNGLQVKCSEVINLKIQNILLGYVNKINDLKLPEDAALLNEGLEYIGTTFMFIPLIKPSPQQAVSEIVDLLCNVIQQTIPEESKTASGDAHDLSKHIAGDPRTKKWREGRRMASTHIIRLFANHSELIPEQTVKMLMEFSQNILKTRNDILVEFCNIVEGLLCLSKMDYAVGVLEHATYIFYEKPVFSAESTPFLKQLGLDLTNPANISNDMNNEEPRLVRSKINTASNLFQAVFRRCKPEILKIVISTKMSENCFLIPFKVLKANSGLWTKEVYDLLKSVNCQGLVDISEAEKKVLLGGERNMQDSEVQGSTDLAVRRLQAFVSHNSDQALVTISNMLRTAPELIEKFEGLLNECLFMYLDSFDLYRYKRVVKHFFSTVLPTTSSKTLLTQSLTYMGNRLRSEYSKIAESYQSGSDLDEEAEILRDKHMTILTREFMSILRDCLFDTKTTFTEKSKKKVPGSPKEWRLNNKGKELLFGQNKFTDLGNTIFETILGLLKIINVDSQSGNQAAQLLWGLCTEFFEMKNHQIANQQPSIALKSMQSQACGPILQGILEGLKIHKSGTDVYASLASLAIEFYFCCRYVFEYCSQTAYNVLKNIPNAREATLKKLDRTLGEKTRMIKWEKGYDNAGVYGSLGIVDKTSRGIFTILTTGLKLSQEEQQRLSRTKAGYDMPPLFQCKDKIVKNDLDVGKGDLIALFADE